eukprot:142954_1
MSAALPRCLFTVPYKFDTNAESMLNLENCRFNAGSRPPFMVVSKDIVPLSSDRSDARDIKSLTTDRDGMSSPSPPTNRSVLLRAHSEASARHCSSHAPSWSTPTGAPMFSSASRSDCLLSPAAEDMSSRASVLSSTIFNAATLSIRPIKTTKKKSSEAETIVL